MKNALTFTVGDGVKDFPEQTLYAIPNEAITTVDAGTATLILAIALDNRSETINTFQPDIHGSLTLDVGFFDAATNQIGPDVNRQIDNKVWPGSYTDEEKSVTYSIPTGTRGFVIERVHPSLEYGQNSDGQNSADLYYRLSVHVAGVYVNIGESINVLETPASIDLPVGTNVVANPTGTSGATLSRIRISGIDYNIVGGQGGGGVTVIANPAGAATGGEIDKIQIDTTIYSIPSGGGGEQNVQSNWAETDTTNDAFIQNKPTVITANERSKLAGIEDGATADQTGSEIVDAIDTQLGSTTWQQGGGSMGTSDYDDLTDKPILRVASLPSSLDADDLGKRYQIISTGEQFKVVGVPHHGVARVVTTRLYADSEDSDYQGEVYSGSDTPDNPTANDIGKWWFVQSGRTFILIDSAIRKEGVPDIPGSDSINGRYDTLQHGEDAVTANNQAFVAGQGHDAHLYYVTAFTAGTPDTTTYHAIPTDNVDATDGVVDSIDASVTSGDLTITLGRSGILSDLSDTVTLPSGGGSDGVVDSVDASVSSGNLTITLGRTGTLADLSDTVTLPAATGDITGVTAGTGLAGGGTSGNVTLRMDAESLNQYGSTSFTPADDLVPMYIDDDSETIAVPLDRLQRAVRRTDAEVVAAVNADLGNTDWQMGGSGSDDGVVDSVDANVVGQDLTITLGRTGTLADLSDTVTLPSGGSGSDDGVVDSIDADVSGQDLTITLGRSGSLADLSDTVTLPGSGGGGTPPSLDGNDLEILFDNRPATETAFSYAAGAMNWSKAFNLDLGRALTEDDDEKDLRIRFSYTQQTGGRWFDLSVNVGAFRSWTEFTIATATSARLPVGHQRFTIGRGASNSDDLNNAWNRHGLVFRRGDLNGNHVLGIAIPGGDGNAGYVALSNMRGVVYLVPSISDLTISGGGGGGLVVADDSGTLRDAEESDWNSSEGKSRVLAYDGSHLLRADRQVTGVHGSSATFTEVPDGTTIPGSISRWRDVHWQDYLVSNPQDHDVYYNRGSHILRRYSGGSWIDVFAGETVLVQLNLVGYADPGIYANQADALEHVTANGQRVLYFDGTNPNLYTVSNYVAPSVGTVSYDWTAARPTQVPAGGVVHHFRGGDRSNSNAIQTDSHPFPSDDNRIGQLAFTPASASSRVSIATSFDMRSDSADNIDDAGLRFAIYRGSDRLGRIHKSYLNVSDGHIDNFDQAVTYKVVDELTSGDAVTYHLHAQRLEDGASSQPIHIDYWLLEAAEYWGNARGIGVFEIQDTFLKWFLGTTDSGRQGGDAQVMDTDFYGNYLTAVTDFTLKEIAFWINVTTAGDFPVFVGKYNISNELTEIVAQTNATASNTGEQFVTHTLDAGFTRGDNFIVGIQAGGTGSGSGYYFTGEGTVTETSDNINWAGYTEDAFASATASVGGTIPTLSTSFSWATRLTYEV